MPTSGELIDSRNEHHEAYGGAQRSIFLFRHPRPAFF
jgi:hypothetical protein